MKGASDSYTNIILEDIRGKMDTVLEIVIAQREEMKTFARQDDLLEIKADIRTIKLAVTDTNKQVASHERRIKKLETYAP